MTSALKQGVCESYVCVYTSPVSPHKSTRFLRAGRDYRGMLSQFAMWPGNRCGWNDLTLVSPEGNTFGFTFLKDLFIFFGELFLKFSLTATILLLFSML